MIYDEANAFFNAVPPHDHVLQDGLGGAWFCQVERCGYGLNIEDMPTFDPFAAEQARYDHARDAWGYAHRPIRTGGVRVGKQAEYERVKAQLVETIGPGRPLVGGGGRVYGHAWDAP